MLYISPLTTLRYLGSSIASAGMSVGLNKLRNHLGHTSAYIREHATPRNVAYATMVAGAVGAAMINPTTRIALCTFLSVSYSMSMITFNLVMLGLYATWLGMKGVGTLGSMGAALAPVVGGVGRSLFSGDVGIPAATPLAIPEVEPLSAPVVVQDFLDDALDAFDRPENRSAGVLEGIQAASSEAELSQIFNLQAAVDALGEDSQAAVLAGGLGAVPVDIGGLEQIFANQAGEGPFEGIGVAAAAVLQDGVQLSQDTVKIPVKKYAAGAAVLGLGALGTFAAYKLYKTIQAQQAQAKIADEQAKVAYASLSSEDLEAADAEFSLSTPFFGNQF